MSSNKRTVSVCQEQREAFDIIYEAAKKYIATSGPGNKIQIGRFRPFREHIEHELLRIINTKLYSLDKNIQISTKFLFKLYCKDQNSGSTEFVFDDEPELKIIINFNAHLKAIYKRGLKQFCLALSDIFSHELLHAIQYLNQYKSVGSNDYLLRSNIFDNKGYLFELDNRYITAVRYTEDLPYFSNYDEIQCYAKDSARQLLTRYKTKEKVIDKLNNTYGWAELSVNSGCFYYYYDCFCVNIPQLSYYNKIWKSFLKKLYLNLQEDWAI